MESKKIYFKRDGEIFFIKRNQYVDNFDYLEFLGFQKIDGKNLDAEKIDIRAHFVGFDHKYSLEFCEGVSLKDGGEIKIVVTFGGNKLTTSMDNTQELKDYKVKIDERIKARHG